MIRLLTLGTPACVVDDVELVELPAQKSRFALLVYLAIERNVSRDDAAALFWGENSEERARHALSQSLYELKRFVGDKWLDTSSGRLIVTDELTCDAHQLAQFCEGKDFNHAADLYRGPFLAGFFLNNSKGFETWVDKQRAHFERLHRKARRECVNALVEAERWPVAIEATRRWTELDPFDDEANHRLIELLALSGDRAQALQAYAAYAARLEEELQIQPLDHTRALVEAIRANGKSAPLAGIEDRPEAPEWRRRAATLRPPRTAALVLGAGAVALAALIGAVLWSSESGAGVLGRGAAFDTTHFAILPFDYDPNVPVRLNEDNLLQDALARWSGISVVDLYQVQAKLAEVQGPLRLKNALWVARNLGAGRYIRGRVSRYGDSLRIHGVLYDANAGGRPIAERTLKVGVNLQRADSAFAQLADALLFRDELPSKGSPTYVSTRSLPARRAFAEAQSAIREWNLVRADSYLVAATRSDPEYAQAYLWLAQVRSWLRLTPAEWAYAAEHAAIGSSKLSGRDQRVADALKALSVGDMEAACGGYEQIAQSDRYDFTAWYGWADCLQRDSRVFASAQSPTGYSFKSNYNQALKAYQRAFIVMPSMHRAFRSRGYEKVRRIFFTSSEHVRSGTAISPDTGAFFAYPSWNADTLAFFPRREFHLRDGLQWASAQGLRTAVKHERQLFFQTAKAWSAAYPEDGDAKEAVAIALDLLGDASAPDTLSHARRLARTRSEMLRIGVSEVWLRIKYSLPSDVAGLKAAASLADSILADRAAVDAVATEALASLAILRGRASLANRILQQPNYISDSYLPRDRAVLGHALLAFASLGGPADTLTALFDRAATIGLADQNEDMAWRIWNERAASLAFPDHRLPIRGTVTIRLLQAELAAARKDAPFVRNWKQAATDMRRGFSPAELSIDAIYPEAWAISQTQGVDSAIAWIDPVLHSIRLTAPEMFADYTRAGALVRALAFRAKLADARGDDRDARKWAIPVTILWNGSDDFLDDHVQEMRRLASTRAAKR